MRSTTKQLRIVLFRAQHPVQPRGQLTRRRYFGQRPRFARRQPPIPPSHLRFVPHRRPRRFHQQPARQGRALLGDVSLPLPAAAGALHRNQPAVAGHLLGPPKALPRTQRQHERQSRDRTHARMHPQPRHLRPQPRLLINLLLPGGSFLFQLLQPAEQIFPPPPSASRPTRTGPRSDS
jgi:hypothetical protein